MSYIGDLVLGQTFDSKFCTVQATGAPTTLSGSPVLSNYVGNSTTEITAGITLTVDFDSRTGLNNVHVVASAGNTYAAQTDNQLVITTGTVNSVSVVGYVVAEFSIQNRFTNAAQFGGQTVTLTGGLPDVNAKTIGGQTASAAGTITFPGSISAEAQGIKKNTALNALQFPIFNSSDNKTPQTGLTVTGTRSIDGAAFASCANAITENGTTGFYKVDLAAADLNGEVIVFRFVPSTGGNIVAITIRTVA